MYLALYSLIFLFIIFTTSVQSDNLDVTGILLCNDKPARGIVAAYDKGYFLQKTSGRKIPVIGNGAGIIQQSTRKALDNEG